MSARRKAAATGVAGGLLTLLAVAQTWAVAEGRRAAPLPGQPGGFVRVGAEIAGRDIVPGVFAVGVVAVAAGLALLAVRSRVRRVVSWLLILAGATVVLAGINAVRVADDLARDTVAVRQLGGTLRVTARPWWPLMAALGGGVCLAAGLIGRRAPDDDSLGSAPLPSTDPWSALDQHEDPNDPV